jgi:hypothetical protein
MQKKGKIVVIGGRDGTRTGGPNNKAFKINAIASVYYFPMI